MEVPMARSGMSWQPRTCFDFASKAAWSKTSVPAIRRAGCRDPEHDEKLVAIGGATVRRRVEVPGETLSLAATMAPREPIRASEGPASAWILDLGGDRVPCERIGVEIADDSFARDFRVEAGGREGSEQPFHTVVQGMWRRRGEEVHKPLVAEFAEVTAARLRLVIIDQSNPPLGVRGVTFSAPAREVVFARPKSADGPFRLYVGNPKAAPPGYDFARNLPERLDPPPTRLVLGERQENPVYRPEPKPLTERWPWLIYVVLGAICALLAVIILDLARTAIALQDQRRLGAPTREVTAGESQA
jgi:hypothetical protein